MIYMYSIWCTVYVNNVTPIFEQTSQNIQNPGLNLKISLSGKIENITEIQNRVSWKFPLEIQQQKS